MNPSPRTGGPHWPLLLLLVAAALARLWDLDGGGVRLDEGYSLLQSETTAGEILSNNRYDPAPPLYLLVLRVWRFLCGPTELAAKLFSALVGVVGVLGVFLATRVRFGRVAATFAAAFVLLHPLHMDASREVRGYALLFAAVAFADWGFARWWRWGKRQDLLLWAAAMCVAVNCHHFAWYVWGIHGLAVLLARPGRRLAIFLAGAAVIIASLPPILAMLDHLAHHQVGTQWIPTPVAWDIAATYKLLGGGQVLAGSELGIGVLAVPLVWGLIYTSLRLRDVDNRVLRPARPVQDRWVLVVPVLLLLLPFVVFVMSLALTPMYLHRYFLICVLPAAVLAGAGAAQLRPRALLAAAVALAVLGGTSIHSYYRSEVVEPEQYVQLRAQTIAAERRSGDVVFYASKFTFTPSVALHPESWDEYLLGPIGGTEGSLILVHCVNRPVAPPGDIGSRGYRRAWLVALTPAEREEAEADTRFRALQPSLEWSHPEGGLYRYTLGVR